MNSSNFSDSQNRFKMAFKYFHLAGLFRSFSFTFTLLCVAPPTTFQHNLFASDFFIVVHYGESIKTCHTHQVHPIMFPFQLCHLTLTELHKTHTTHIHTQPRKTLTSNQLRNHMIFGCDHISKYEMECLNAACNHRHRHRHRHYHQLTKFERKQVIFRMKIFFIAVSQWHMTKLEYAIHVSIYDK